MSFPERPKSLLTLVGQATFTGFRSAPGEIQLKMTGKHAIIIHQVSRKRFWASWAGGRPLISMTRQLIDGNLYAVKRQVAERFYQQVTAWVWTRNGVTVAEPTENEIY